MELPYKDMQVDHINPVHLGGNNEDENLNNAYEFTEGQLNEIHHTHKAAKQALEASQSGQLFERTVCRVCGCDDLHACPGGCYSVEGDLCSHCVEREESPNR